MILFREYYKEANDSIETRRELVDEIFEKATKKQSGKVYKFAVRYGGAIAAVLVISAAAIFYPQIQKMNENVPVTVSEVKNGETALGGNEESVDDLAEKVMPAKENATQDETESDVDGYTAEKTLNATVTNDIKKASRTITEDFAIVGGRVPFENVLDVDDAEKEVVSSFLHSVFGEVDSETQKQLIFEIAGKFESNSEAFYLGRWRWWVIDHSSLLTEFVLDESLTKMYECRIEDDEIIWATENNLLEK